MPTSNVTVYTFQTGELAHAIRVVLRNGEPWFVARDLLVALDLDRTSLERLDDDEKGVDSIHTPGGAQSLTVITESGLYVLILGSRKPEAKPFKRWLTREVLPSIARTGAYVDSDARMGATLAGATSNAVDLTRPESLPDGQALFAALALMNEQLGKLVKQMTVDRAASDRRARDLQRTFSRDLGRITRITKSQRPNNRNADPNRPLSDDDVERFRYLLSTGATAKQIARSLNRTYAVIQRFIETNQDLVVRTLQHSLL